MTTDKLQAAIESLRLAMHNDDSPGLYVLAIAEVLAKLRDALAEAQQRIAIMTPALTDARVDVAEVREAHAETRRLVDALAGSPTALDVDCYTVRSSDGKRERQVAFVDPRPMPPTLEGSTPSATLRCEDCGNNRWLVIGSRLCTKCQERDRLREALHEVLDDLDGMLIGMDAATYQRPSEYARRRKQERLAELRKVLAP